MSTYRGGLEIDDDLKLQRREWNIERAGRMALLLIALAGLVGLLGPGPLSSTVAGERGSPLWVEYNRFEHLESPIVIHVYARAGSPATEVAITQGYLARFQLEGIEPAPARVRTAPEETVYQFNTEPGLGILRIDIRLKAGDPALATGEVRLPGGSSVSLSQLIYP